MAIILESLYKEHQELTNEISKITNKIFAINQMIVAYGGNIPDYDELEDEPQQVDISNVPLFDEYNPTTTYRQKILFVLNELGKATATRIANFIHQNEKDLKFEQLHKTITQYCWMMSKEGEIKSSKLDSRTNEYSLI